MIGLRFRAIRRFDSKSEAYLPLIWIDPAGNSYPWGNFNALFPKTVGRCFQAGENGQVFDQIEWHREVNAE